MVHIEGCYVPKCLLIKPCLKIVLCLFRNVKYCTQNGFNNILLIMHYMYIMGKQLLMKVG
jgi:hypothetical protein